MRASLSFVYEKCWACVLSKKFGIRISFISQELKDGAIHEVVDLWNEDDNRIDEALHCLASYPHISTCKVQSRSKDGCIARISITLEHRTCPLYPTIEAFETNAKFPAVERLDLCGMMHWDLTVKGRKQLDKLKDNLEERFMIENILVRRRSENRLTSKSMFLLKEAFERGYFDVPKKISTEGLSKELKIAPSTLNVDIRRALRTVLREATH